MVTFTQEHMDAIKEMADLSMFKDNGWKLTVVRTMGKEMDWYSLVFTIARESEGGREAIQMYANGAVKISGVRNGMEHIEGTKLSAIQLDALSTTALRISDITYRLLRKPTI